MSSETITVQMHYSRTTGLWDAVVRHHPGTKGQPRALWASTGDLPAAADPEEVTHHVLSILASETAQVMVPMGTRDPWAGSA